LGVRAIIEEAILHLIADATKVSYKECMPTEWGYPEEQGADNSRRVSEGQQPYLLPAPMTSLIVEPPLIESGTKTTLSWSAHFISDCDISPNIGVVPQSGTRVVFPQATTTYKLVCKGRGGGSESNATVNVLNPGQLRQFDTSTPQMQFAPVVTEPLPTSSLICNPPTIEKGARTILSWSAQNCSECNIMPDIGAVAPTGTLVVSPQFSTNYRLVCRGKGGNADSSVTVNVVQPEAVQSLEPSVPATVSRHGAALRASVQTLEPPPVPAEQQVAVSAPMPTLFIDPATMGVIQPVAPLVPVEVKIKQAAKLTAVEQPPAEVADPSPTANLASDLATMAASVNEIQLPSDSDNDGVPDEFDKCPNTPTGTEVDKYGCPKTECQSMTISTHFETNESCLNGNCHEEVKAVADKLKMCPKSTVLIEGHTDNRGSYESNLLLSQRRANAAKKYLVRTFGINADRISTIGYSGTKPIDTNNTEAGRVINRRVVLKVLSQD
jgi:outer membrane protein OmpA-like peptidoglycan-associated protein